MGKLVRDRIPEIIEADGKKPITRILLEDVLEVLFAICEVSLISENV